MRFRHFVPALAAVMFALTAPAADAPKVSARNAATLVAEGKAVLVDCREVAEVKSTGIAAPAVLLPTSDFEGDQKQWKEFLAANRDRQILIYCRSGSRSERIASELREKGMKAANIGGLKDWVAAGLPTRDADTPPIPAKPPVQK
jgi:rhodanese-related sulfurtransferase